MAINTRPIGRYLARACERAVGCLEQLTGDSKARSVAAGLWSGGMAYGPITPAVLSLLRNNVPRLYRSAPDGALLPVTLPPLITYNVPVL